MSFTPQRGDVQISPAVFGGLVTVQAASTLPEGVSPDNQDCAFLPGSVFSRAALQKVFTIALPAVGGVVPTVAYGKTFVGPTGAIENLYLASNGNLYWEDPVAAPGVYNNFGSVTVGSWAKSITAFGREFIAPSDGLHGSDVPLQWDGTNLDRVTQDGPGAPPNIATSAIAASTLAANGLTRTGNVVTATTTGAHSLQVGYQAQVSSVTAQVIGGGVSAISINNENAPGVATVTTFAPHGLLPGLFVSLTGVFGTAIGGGIAFIQRVGQVVTVSTNTNHGLSPGAVVTIAGVAVSSFNTVAQVQSVSSLTVFSFIQADIDVASSGGTVSINWPIPNTATPSYFEVLSAPTTTSFQIAINYSNGNWNTGIITYAWDGTFLVSSIPSATTFTYQQYGPAVTCVGSGTVTPFGQIAPGPHQVQVLFLTRQGTITKGSPPVKFFASGGDYPVVSNIPIGPSNVVARILAFTGASGSTFFYIPSTPQVNGQTIGTSTQINDNTTTSATLDFSDPTLFSAIGISIPGNDITNQIVLDGALGFGLYAGRLITWGQRNRIQNLLNCGFDGGYLPSAPTLPAGWVASGGALAAGHYGQGWQAAGAGSLAQSAYQDAYGAPILTAATTYKFRAWLRGVGTTVTATIASASTGFSATATLNGLAAGSFSEANFSQAMPSPIPADMTLAITWTGVPLLDEISIIYQQNPYLDTVLYASYVNNPEAFDGVTGKFGSSNDQKKVMDISDIRNTGYLLTQDPGGRMHEFTDNGVTEPTGWNVRQVASNCGLLSAFGLTKSQADDSSAAGGEEWFAWASKVGARIFGGAEPFEISREIFPNWAAIAPAFQQYCWALNDPAARTIYFGVAVVGNPQGVANRVYSMNYVGLDSAFAIGTTGPVKIGFTGKRIATDHSRKWTKWNTNVLLNGAALMFRGTGDLQPVFFGGNGTVLNSLAGPGQAYTLNPAKYTDDFYGRLFPYYVTFMMPGDEMEQAKEIAGYRKLLAYLMAYISAPVASTLTVTPYADQLTTPWAVVTTRTLSANPTSDIELGGGSAIGNRIALKFSVAPPTGTDCGFNLQRFTAWMRKTRLSVRGTV